MDYVAEAVMSDSQIHAVQSQMLLQSLLEGLRLAAAAAAGMPSTQVDIKGPAQGVPQPAQGVDATVTFRVEWLVREPSLEDVETRVAALLPDYNPQTNPALRRPHHELKAAYLQCGEETETQAREVQRTALKFRRLARHRQLPKHLGEFAVARAEHVAARHIHSVALGLEAQSLARWLDALHLS